MVQQPPVITNSWAVIDWLADPESGWDPGRSRTKAIKGSVAPGRVGEARTAELLVTGHLLTWYVTVKRPCFYEPHFPRVHHWKMTASTSQVVKRLNEMTHESLYIAPGGWVGSASTQ